MNYTIYETNNYSMSTDKLGYILTRTKDGAELYFQGDDAELWRRNISQMEKTHQGDDESFDESFDFLCSGYDEILDSIQAR